MPDNIHFNVLFNKVQAAKINLNNIDNCNNFNKFKDKGSEKIDNKTIGAAPAGRMAVLQKENDHWQIIAYANLDKIG